MYKGLKSIYLFALFMGFSAQAQLDPLSLFNNNQVFESVSDIDDTDPVRDVDLKKDGSIQENNFKDDSYSYTGGEDFNNPPKSKFRDQPLEYFGYDYFSELTSTFSQLMDVPVPPDYLIGPQDTIKIILFGTEGEIVDFYKRLLVY